MNSADELDWFDKDEDKILADLEQQRQERKTYDTSLNSANTLEVISVSSATDEYLKNISLEAGETSVAESSTSKISTTDLRKMSQLPPLDAFLYAVTHESNFFFNQVAANDSQERVLLYTRILAIICRLELPGFHVEVLQHVAENQQLLEHFRTLATKLYSQRFKSLWTDENRVEALVHDIQLLLLQAHDVGVLGAQGLNAVRHIYQLASNSDSPEVACLPICEEFLEQLKFVLSSEKKTKNEISLMDRQLPHKFSALPTDIYPTLEKLLEAPCEEKVENDSPNTDSETEEIIGTVKEAATSSVSETKNMINVNDYLNHQKWLLQEDFIIPLRQYVQLLRQTQELDRFYEKHVLLQCVQIVLNEEFLETEHCEMLFIVTLGNQRAKNSKKRVGKETHGTLKNLKTGALLCLTTSIEFENLLLARVVYTAENMLKKGYIGVQIVRQHNIGSIYGKEFIMFETPAFFEPYYNVFNYLRSCNVMDFPMKQYIVFGEKNTKAPAYLKPNTVYEYGQYAFKPLEQEQLQQTQNIALPLNPSQLLAYSNALREDFCLIQGPPGTGKTHLSVHLVKTLMDNAAGKPIVLVTYTNESLDKFLLKLSVFTDDILRFGSQTRQPEIAKYNVRNMMDSAPVNPKLNRLYYVTKEEYKTRFQQLQTLYKEFDGTEENYQQILQAQRDVRHVDRKRNSIRLMFQYYVAREKGIIAMTSTCAAKTNFLFRLLQSAIVVFEEAAEILESHVIACLTPYTQHVIMIGDHLQLQPYTSTFQHSRSSEMNVSLFERLILQGFKPSVLNTQYRMRPEIAALICPTIYVELQNAPNVQSYPPVRKMSKNVYFLNHNQSECKAKHESSIYNQYEIERIILLAMYLTIQAEYDPADIVILSPYAKQIELISEKLKSNSSLKKVKATTVDSFQGLEANIVLLTLVRSNDVGQIGFLKEQNRICVALSRAKHGLYMIGNLDLLARCNKTWKSIKASLNKQDAIGDDFPSDTSQDREAIETT